MSNDKNYQVVKTFETNDIQAAFPNIIKMDTEALIGGNTRVRKYNSQAIIDTDKDLILSFMSNTYKFVDNRDFILPIYQKLQTMFKVSTSVEVINGARFKVNLTLDNPEIGLEVIPGDVVKPSFTFHNSYDGSCRASYGLGFMRLVCTNGMMAFEQVSGSSKKHSKSMNLSLELGEAIEFVNGIRGKKEKFDVLTEKQMTEEEAQRAVEEVEKRVTKFPRKKLDLVIPKWKEENQKLEVADGTAWGLYNGFNFFLSHESGSMPYEDRKKVDTKIMNILSN